MAETFRDVLLHGELLIKNSLYKQRQGFIDIDSNCSQHTKKQEAQEGGYILWPSPFIDWVISLLVRKATTMKLNARKEGRLQIFCEGVQIKAKLWFPKVIKIDFYEGFIWQKHSAHTAGNLWAGGNCQNVPVTQEDSLVSDNDLLP